MDYYVTIIQETSFRLQHRQPSPPTRTCSQIPSLPPDRVPSSIWATDVTLRTSPGDSKFWLNSIPVTRSEN